jgi:hypothetical protein
VLSLRYCPCFSWPIDKRLSRPVRCYFIYKWPAAQALPVRIEGAVETLVCINLPFAVAIKRKTLKSWENWKVFSGPVLDYKRPLKGPCREIILLLLGWESGGFPLKILHCSVQHRQCSLQTASTVIWGSLNKRNWGNWLIKVEVGTTVSILWGQVVQSTLPAHK